MSIKSRESRENTSTSNYPQENIIPAEIHKMIITITNG